MIVNITTNYLLPTTYVCMSEVHSRPFIHYSQTRIVIIATFIENCLPSVPVGESVETKTLVGVLLMGNELRRQSILVRCAQQQHKYVWSPLLMNHLPLSVVIESGSFRDPRYQVP